MPQSVNGSADRKILVVEDNEMNRDILGRRLTKRGFAVAYAVDGEEAVEASKNEAPDLILMDINLPKLSGWDATRQIKAADDTKDIPVIALTAKAFESDREESIAAGCDDFATKPVNFPDLLKKIEDALNA